MLCDFSALAFTMRWSDDADLSKATLDVLGFLQVTWHSQRRVARTLRPVRERGKLRGGRGSIPYTNGLHDLCDNVVLGLSKEKWASAMGFMGPRKKVSSRTHLHIFQAVLLAYAA